MGEGALTGGQAFVFDGAAVTVALGSGVVEAVVAGGVADAAGESTAAAS